MDRSDGSALLFIRITVIKHMLWTESHNENFVIQDRLCQYEHVGKQIIVKMSKNA